MGLKWDPTWTWKKKQWYKAKLKVHEPERAKAEYREWLKKQLAQQGWDEPGHWQEVSRDNMKVANPLYVAKPYSPTNLYPIAAPLPSQVKGLTKNTPRESKTKRPPRELRAK